MSILFYSVDVPVLSSSFLELEGFWTFVFGQVGFFIACLVFEIMAIQALLKARDFRGKIFLYELGVVVLLSVVANIAHYYYILDAYEMMLSMTRV